MSNQTAQNMFSSLAVSTLVSTMNWRTPSSALVHANRDTLDENRCATEFIVSILAPNRRVGVYNDGENHFQCGRDDFEFDAQCNGNSRKWYALSFDGLCVLCVEWRWFVLETMEQDAASKQSFPLREFSQTGKHSGDDIVCDDIV